MPVSPPKSVTRKARAKINLYLHVTGQRDDGYHELDSLVAFADIGDTLTVSAGQGGLSLELIGPFAQDLNDDSENNLVLHAARALAAHAGVAPNAHIVLEKNLPVASGIGGGSADAAAALLALYTFWGIELHDDDIHHVAHDVADDVDTARALSTLFKVWRDDLDADLLGAIGLELGADVPVCLADRPVFMGGIGEKLELAPHLPHAWLVLANPGVAVSTPGVFRARAEAQGENFSNPARFQGHPRDAAHFAEILAGRHNDLMAPAIALEPVIQDVLDALAAQDGCLLARMSGSGATCFGLFTRIPEALAAAGRLAAAHPGWWVEAAELLDAPVDF